MVSIIKTNTLKQDIHLKILIKFVCAIIGLVLCMLYIKYQVRMNIVYLIKKVSN